MDPKTFQPLPHRSLSASGEPQLSYTYAGRPTVHAVIDTPMAWRAARLQLIVKELEYCWSLSNELLVTSGRERIAAAGQKGPITSYDGTNRDHLIRRAFYTALVVTYGKVFASTGKGRTSLQAREVFKGDAQKFLAFHVWVITNRRNSFVAHAGESDLEDARTVLVLPLPYSFEPWHAVVHHATFSVGPQYEELAAFCTLVEFVLTHVRGKVDEIKELMLAEVAAGSRVEQYRTTTEQTPQPSPTTAIPFWWVNQTP